ncbi:Hypothetical_protein [Hexamita inflata]|uniref:Hypothetical_protein n=1 Tax=Hexamita inflata TaxID=28002 RepID=A0AA86TXQ2_9EUKA|nr:Hypothetical protein HINF_LOCUS18587 [Hexamita inflata]
MFQQNSVQEYILQNLVDVDIKQSVTILHYYEQKFALSKQTSSKLIELKLFQPQFPFDSFNQSTITPSNNSSFSQQLSVFDELLLENISSNGQPIEIKRVRLNQASCLEIITQTLLLFGFSLSKIRSSEICKLVEETNQKQFWAQTELVQSQFQAAEIRKFYEKNFKGLN